MPLPTRSVTPGHERAHEPSETQQRRLRRARSRRWRIARTIGVPLLLGALVTAGSPGWSPYTIKRGDTLSEIAARYHTTVAKLVQVNRLPGHGNLIIAGHTLQVPTGGSGSTSRLATVHYRHRVVVGDSLIKIANEFHVAPSVVARANHLPSTNIVRLGDTLVIPVRRRIATTQSDHTRSGNSFAGRTYPDSTVGAAARNRAILARRHLPTQAQMRSLIIRKARANGVDPALALAVSWQEAGWQMHHVSVANAIGAMQVIPATGDWISGVVGRRLDLLDPSDNVTAGVVLLRVLTHSASERQAVAGYYQGLGSVRAHGMYRDTKQYVANVMSLKRRFG